MTRVRYRIDVDFEDFQPVLADNSDAMDTYVRSAILKGCPLDHIRISVASFTNVPLPGIFEL